MSGCSPRAAVITALVGVNAAGPVGADSSTTTPRSVARVADGVYVVRHKDAPDAFPQGNTTVIVGARGTLVVDSGYLPSTAREDIAQIRQWTDKPVRYLLNTHWHYDHTLGNAAYRDAFPGLSIVAHSQTRRQVAGYNPGWFARYPDRYKTADERNEWVATQPIGMPPHSLLEGLSFDRDGNLWCVDVPNGRVFKVTREAPSTSSPSTTAGPTGCASIATGASSSPITSTASCCSTVLPRYPIRGIFAGCCA